MLSIFQRLSCALIGHQVLNILLTCIFLSISTTVALVQALISSGLEYTQSLLTRLPTLVIFAPQICFLHCCTDDLTELMTNLIRHHSPVSVLH